MISGIIIFEQGGVQQIGELKSLSNIIETIRIILPDLEQKELNRVLSQVSDTDLKRLIAERENNAAIGKTEKLN